MLGHHVNEEVLAKCSRCGMPTQVRVALDDPFTSCRTIVLSFGGCDAPIALAGSWFGKRSAKTPLTMREVYISGRLHRVLCDLSPRGFVPATTLVHSLEEEDNK